MPKVRKYARWASVRIPVMSKEESAILDDIEHNLHRKGTSFDTGTSWPGKFEQRDWELDWSLSGKKTPRQLIDLLKRKGFKPKVKWLNPKKHVERVFGKDGVPKHIKRKI